MMRPMQTLDLPQSVLAVLEPLFERLPLDQALTQLVVQEPLSNDLTELVEKLVTDPAIAKRPALVSTLWLYVDELDRSHTLSQSMHTATGSYLHGIMHRREGDFSNSHYWMYQAGSHPVLSQIDGYDPHQFIDDVQANPTSTKLAQLQREEWVALVNYCVNS